MDAKSFREVGEGLLSTLGLESLPDVILLAQQCVRSGNWDQAREICEAGLSQLGHDPALNVVLAMVELGKGNFAQAEELLEQVRELHPNHLVGLFTAAWMKIESGQPSKAVSDLLEVVRRFPDYPGALGTLASVLMPGPSYRDVLAYIHRAIRPKTYLEIGIETGATLQLAHAAEVVVGVDPNLSSIKPNAKFEGAQFFGTTSDEFFKNNTVASVFGRYPLDLVFIDGMHRFEFALRDFCNVENWADLATVVVIHDVLPIVPLVAERERRTKFWVGDVWKALWLLLEIRKDLAISVIPTPPSGLGVVRGLNPKNAPDRSRWIAAVDQYSGLSYPSSEPGMWPQHLPLVENSRNGWNKALGLTEEQS